MIKVLASSHFDPLHWGHVSYLNGAKSLGDYLVASVSPDDQVLAKKGFVVMPLEERLNIVATLKCVDVAMITAGSVPNQVQTLEMMHPNIFAKGGDSTLSALPPEEIEICQRIKCKIVFNVGDYYRGGTLLSSSQICRDLLWQLAYKDTVKYGKGWLTEPLYTIFNEKRPQVGVNIVVINNLNKILLLKSNTHPSEGMWVLPGGLVERGEKIQYAAIRELTEETNITVSPQDLHFVIVQDYFYTGRHDVGITFRVNVEETQINLNQENRLRAWFSPSKLPQSMHVATQTAIKRAVSE